VYSYKIKNFIYYSINYIIKEDFLPAFKAIYNKIITIDNIYSAFKSINLILFNLEAIVLKLNI
jgi:hypothetical protein